MKYVLPHSFVHQRVPHIWSESPRYSYNIRQFLRHSRRRRRQRELAPLRRSRNIACVGTARPVHRWIAMAGPIGMTRIPGPDPRGIGILGISVRELAHRHQQQAFPQLAQPILEFVVQTLKVGLRRPQPARSRRRASAPSLRLASIELWASSASGCRASCMA